MKEYVLGFEEKTTQHWVFTFLEVNLRQTYNPV